MMILTMLALGAVLQQPAAKAAPPPRTPPAQQPAAVTPPQPTTPYDSTVAALSDIGTKVAEVRSTYELYRRSAYNAPNGALLERAALYRTTCRALSAAVRQGERRICRNCLPPDVQPAVNQYRAQLPALRTLADRCATRIDRHRAKGTEDVVAAAMRADVRAEGDRLVAGLRPYEARVTDVRRVMGWDNTPNVPTPRRGS